jgi:hypothetical protein
MISAYYGISGSCPERQCAAIALGEELEPKNDYPGNCAKESRMEE